MKRTYKAENTSTQISDVVRKMDVDLSRYRKLVDTLPVTVTREGLEIASADLPLILLRSLPGDCRAYVMLHAKDEGYTELRAAAIRFESRLFFNLVVPVNKVFMFHQGRNFNSSSFSYVFPSKFCSFSQLDSILYTHNHPPCPRRLNKLRLILLANMRAFGFAF